jgi:hypothetical protein
VARTGVTLAEGGDLFSCSFYGQSLQPIADTPERALAIMMEMKV